MTLEREIACAPDRAVSEPFEVGFLLVPDWPMLAFSSALEPLRIANRLSGRSLYHWRLFSIDDHPVAASNGISVAPDCSLDQASDVNVLLVLSGIDAQRYCTPEMVRCLRRLANDGVELGGISLGSIILASAGLLDRHRCTIHWENLDSFADQFPQLKVSPELYEIDRQRLTCSGGTAALDMVLLIIGRHHGHDLAAAVAEQCIHPQIRDSREQQRMQLRTRLDVAHPKVLRVVARMRTALEEPVSLVTLAREVHLTLRQLERLFQHHFSMTPKRYYLALRLERARGFLRQTSMPIVAIAAACGFSSAAYFATCYRRHFGCRPTQERSG